MGRLVVVCNRLPLRLQVQEAGEKVEFAPSAGRDYRQVRRFRRLLR